MDEPVSFSDDVLPICLERATFVEELLRGGKLGIVTGCGNLYEEGRAPLYLNEVSNLDLIRRTQISLLYCGGED